MKYKGKSIEGTNRASVHFKKNDEIISLTVVPLSLSWIERIRNIPTFTLPSPPRHVAMDRKGKPIRNEQTGQLEMVPNFEDPEYSKKFDRVQQRFEAVKFYGHLREDDDVEFEHTMPENSDDRAWAGFADSIAQEIVDSGFTQGEIDHVLEVGMELACDIVGDEDVANFYNSRRTDSHPTNGEASSKTKSDNDSNTQQPIMSTA